MATRTLKKKAGKHGKRRSFSESAERMIYRPLQGDGKATQAAIIVESALSKTTSLVVNNLGWANATLLALALTNTIDVSSWSDLGNAWFYFLIVFVSGVIGAVLPRTWEDVHEVARELEIKVPQKLAKQGDEEQKLKDDKKIETAKKRGEKKKRKEETMQYRLLHFVEVEADAIGENFEDLAVGTISNVIAMGVRDAAKESFGAIVGYDDDGSLTTTSYVFYAFIISILAVVLTIWLGKLYDVYEKGVYRDIEEQGIEEAKDELIVFAFRKRILKLTMTMMALCMAWSWRDAIKSLILAMYSGDTDTTPHMWLYCLTATFAIAINDTICTQYYLLYPKNESVTNLRMGSKSRELLSTMLTNNVNYVVALSWYDAVSTSFTNNGDWEVWQKTLFWWITAIGLQVLSLVLKFFWEKWMMQLKIFSIGLVHAFHARFDNVLDPLHLLQEDTDELKKAEEVVPFWRQFVEESGTLIIYAWGTSSSLFITQALKYSISASYSDYYDYDSGEIKNSHIWALWVAVLASIGISTLVVTYFSRLVNKIKSRRKEIFAQIKEEAKQQGHGAEVLTPVSHDSDNDSENENKFDEFDNNEEEDDDDDFNPNEDNKNNANDTINATETTDADDPDAVKPREHTKFTELGAGADTGAGGD